MRRIRIDEFRSFKAAGDYFLWFELASIEPSLVCARETLGVWYREPVQLPERLQTTYREQIDGLRPMVGR